MGQTMGHAGVAVSGKQHTKLYKNISYTLTKLPQKFFDSCTFAR